MQIKNPISLCVYHFPTTQYLEIFDYVLARFVYYTIAIEVLSSSTLLIAAPEY
jgi:hypothetical protein